MKSKLHYFFVLILITLGCYPNVKTKIITFDAAKDTTFIITRYYNPNIMKIVIDSKIDGEPILLLKNENLIDTFNLSSEKNNYSFEFHEKKAEFSYKKLNVKNGKITLHIQMN
jgi:hypothetical protein